VDGAITIVGSIVYEDTVLDVVGRYVGSRWPSGNTLASDASVLGSTLKFDTGSHPFGVVEM